MVLLDYHPCEENIGTILERTCPRVPLQITSCIRLILWDSCDQMIRQSRFQKQGQCYTTAFQKMLKKTLVLAWALIMLDLIVATIWTSPFNRCIQYIRICVVRAHWQCGAIRIKCWNASVLSNIGYKNRIYLTNITYRVDFVHYLQLFNGFIPFTARSVRIRINEGEHCGRVCIHYTLWFISRTWSKHN